MDFDYGFEYALPEVAEDAFMGAVSVIAGIVLLVVLVFMAIGIVCYVLNAVGMYRIAKHRGIHHAWLAWIPVGSNWLLGSIADHYQYVAKQKVTNRRKILLILSAVLAALNSGLLGSSVGMLVSSAEAGANGAAAAILLMALFNLFGTGVLIAVCVFRYIAYFDLYRSCKPKNDVLFLVLSILFSVTTAFFVFACSNSDEGMPAKRAPEAPKQISCEEDGEDCGEEAETAAEETVEEEIPEVEAEVVEDPE